MEYNKEELHQITEEFIKCFSKINKCNCLQNKDTIIKKEKVVDGISIFNTKIIIDNSNSEVKINNENIENNIDFIKWKKEHLIEKKIGKIDYIYDYNTRKQLYNYDIFNNRYIIKHCGFVKIKYTYQNKEIEITGKSSQLGKIYFDNFNNLILNFKNHNINIYININNVDYNLYNCFIISRECSSRNVAEINICIDDIDEVIGLDLVDFLKEELLRYKSRNTNSKYSVKFAAIHGSVDSDINTVIKRIFDKIESSSSGENYHDRYLHLNRLKYIGYNIRHNKYYDKIKLDITNGFEGIMKEINSQIKNQISNKIFLLNLSVDKSSNIFKEIDILHTFYNRYSILENENKRLREELEKYKTPQEGILIDLLS